MRILLVVSVFLAGCGAGHSAGGTGGAAGASGARGAGGHPGGGSAGAGIDAHPSDAPAADAPSGRRQSVYMTFYGWPDNSPPGGAIAYPKSDGFPTVHETAGGAGTYDDPITFATDKAEFPAGTRLFAPVLEKYLIMEDDCAECDTDWTSSQKRTSTSG